MRVIIAIIDFIAWRIRHAVARRRPPVPCSLFPVPSTLSGPTEGPGCVTDDASEHGRLLSGMMPASPSAGPVPSWHRFLNYDNTRAACAAALQKRPDFIPGPTVPLVITGQGDFIHTWP